MAKSKKPNKEEEQLLEEHRREKAASEALEARKKKEREEEEKQRKPFAVHEETIQKAVENCEGHLRKLKNLELAREVLRRLTEQVKRGLPKTY